MKKILVVATAGAGGDLQPLIAAALGLRQRGHQLVFFGDASVMRAAGGLGWRTGMDAFQSAPEHDLGPRLITAIRDASGLDGQAQGEFVERRIADWSGDLAPEVRDLVRQHKPDLVVTSLFGVGAVQMACAGSSVPWCVINSTFYVGPEPPRRMESDFSARAAPLIRYFGSRLGEARLVLHASDRVFDYNNARLPPSHHYVGPLVWEAPAPVPAYLDEPGDPWVLVTLSSQQQDDVGLAEVVLDALSDKSVRVLLTVGDGHEPRELAHIPANARVEQYVPHSSVLERSRLLISHAGHGSVMKALLHGVPMVLVPWGRDQPGVAARAHDLGVARIIPRDQLSPEQVTQAVRSGLDDVQLRETAAATSRRLRAQDPVAVACALLEDI